MPAQIPHQTTIGRFKRIALTIPAIRWLNRQRHQLRTLGAQLVNRDVHTAETRVQTGMPGPEVNRPSQPKIDIPSNENAYLMIGTSAKDFLYAIDQFSVFQGTVRVSGWAYDPTSRIKRLALRFPSGRNYELTNFKLPSPDVTEVHSQNMKDCQFDDVFYMPQDTADAMKAELVIEFDEKPSKVISTLGGIATDPARMLHARFLSLLKGKSIEQPSGHLLEIGSRARSGITRRDIIPERWQYTGLDVLPGPNVDIVGDAHRLSHI